MNQFEFLKQKLCGILHRYKAKRSLYNALYNVDACEDDFKGLVYSIIALLYSGAKIHEDLNRLLEFSNSHNKQSENLFNILNQQKVVSGAKIHEDLNRLLEYSNSQNKQSENLLTILNQQKVVLDSLLSSVSKTSDTPHRCNNTYEIHILQEIASFLNGRVFIDVGAHRGNFSEGLLNAGFSVFAVEPQPEIYSELISRFYGISEFKAIQAAVASQKKMLKMFRVGNFQKQIKVDDTSLYTTAIEHSLLSGLNFTDTFLSEAYSINDLLQMHKISISEIAGIKIDAEGMDYEILSSLPSDFQFPVVLCEFWETGHCFSGGTLSSPSNLVPLMREKGYKNSILVYRDDENRIGILMNSNKAPKGAWGNIFFTSSLEIYSKLLEAAWRRFFTEYRG